MSPATTPHCVVILAASARIRAMRSWLMRKTNRRLAIYRQERGVAEDTGGTGSQAHILAHHTTSRSHCGRSTSFPTHLHHRVIAEAPFGATQHRPSIDIDGPPTFIGNEEVTVVFQFDNTYGTEKKKNGVVGEDQKRAQSPHVPSLIPGVGLEGTQDSQIRDLEMPAHP